MLEAEQWLNVSLPTGNHSAAPRKPGLQLLSLLVVVESWLVMRSSCREQQAVTAVHEIIPQEQDKEEQVS